MFIKMGSIHKTEIFSFIGNNVGDNGMEQVV